MVEVLVPPILSYAAWKEIVTTPAPFWKYLKNNSEGVEAFVRKAVKDPGLWGGAKVACYNLTPKELRAKIKKALILLHTSIDSDNLEILYGYDQREVILSVFPFTETFELPAQANDPLTLDMGRTVLYAAVTATAGALYPQEPLKGLYEVLGRIRLTYPVHRAILDCFIDSGDGEFIPTLQ